MAWLYMQGLHRVLNMSEYGLYASVMTEYTSMYHNVMFNVSGHGWLLLNVTNYA